MTGRMLLWMLSDESTTATAPTQAALASPPVISKLEAPSTERTDPKDEPMTPGAALTAPAKGTGKGDKGNKGFGPGGAHGGSNVAAPY